MVNKAEHQSGLEELSSLQNAITQYLHKMIFGITGIIALCCSTENVQADTEPLENKVIRNNQEKLHELEKQLEEIEAKILHLSLELLDLKIETSALFMDLKLSRANDDKFKKVIKNILAGCLQRYHWEQELKKAQEKACTIRIQIASLQLTAHIPQ